MKKRVVYGMLVLCLVSSIIFTGCKTKKQEVDENNNTKQALNKKMKNDDVKDGVIKDDAIMLTVGDIDVTYSEAMVYLMLYKSEYDGLMSKDVWSFEVEKGKSF